MMTNAIARSTFRRELRCYDIDAIRAHYPNLIRLLGKDGERIVQNWKVSRSWYALHAIQFTWRNRRALRWAAAHQ